MSKDKSKKKVVQKTNSGDKQKKPENENSKFVIEVKFQGKHY